MPENENFTGGENEMVATEEAVAAVIGTRTMAEAAEQLGCSESTLYRIARTPEYLELMSRAKRKIIDLAIEQSENLLLSALNTVADVMCSEDSSPQIKLNAAQLLINTVTRLHDTRFKKYQTDKGTAYSVDDILRLWDYTRKKVDNPPQRPIKQVDPRGDPFGWN